MSQVPVEQVPVEQLSPSQIVLLRGEAFVRWRGKLELPSGAKVSSRALSETLIEVAFLACAAQGVLELQVRPRKTLLGLWTVPVLFAEPQRTPVPWPRPTLEAWLAHLAAQLRPEERHRVQSLVYVLLRENSPNPWRRVVEEVQGGLVAMGILERMEEQKKPAKRQRAQIAVAVEDSVASLPTGHVQALLRTCRLTSPQLWRLLRKEVSRGIGYRQKFSEQRAT